MMNEASMSSRNLHDCIYDVIDAVNELADTPTDDSRYPHLLTDVVGLCVALAEAGEATTRKATPAATLVDPAALSSLGERIAWLRIQRKGIRQIARELGVNPSTVSRRLRKF
jgi:DNA-binding CsgD family transcriptional regulator